MSMSTRRGDFSSWRLGHRVSGHRGEGGKSTARLFELCSSWLGWGKTNSNYVANARQGQGHITGGAVAVFKWLRNPWEAEFDLMTCRRMGTREAILTGVASPFALVNIGGEMGWRQVEVPPVSGLQRIKGRLLPSMPPLHGASWQDKDRTRRLNLVCNHLKSSARPSGSGWRSRAQIWGSKCATAA